MANLEKSNVGGANATRIATAHAHHGGKNEYGLMLNVSMTAALGKIAD